MRPISETIEDARRVRAEAVRIRMEAQACRARAVAMMQRCREDLARMTERPPFS